ncbi:MAG: DegQ family serine endoprotease [Acidobacteriota bacterium]
MKLGNRSMLAGAAFVAVGAVGGAWITAQTRQFPFSFNQVPAAAQSTADPDVSFRSGFGPVVKKVQPAVVSITSRTEAKVSQNRQGRQNLPEGLDLRQFFGNGNGPSPFDEPQGPRSGLGSGVITTADGYIVTNNHVVDGADKVTVKLADNREFVAKVIGKDAMTDVAVVKIEASGLPHLTIGNSDKVEVGDIVLAMGNPFGVGQTVTMGIVGATHRNTNEGIEEYEDFIQTDAAINPGNSGGALVNLRGELVGINTAILSRSGGNQGIGFAIPVKTVSNVMNQIVKSGKVSRGFMGVTIQNMTPEIARQFGMKNDIHGALIGDVTSGSPADKAGLKSGDIVTAVDGSRVEDQPDLRLKIAALNPNSMAHLKVFRDGSEKDFNVVLGSQPGDRAAAVTPGSQSNDGPRLGISVEPSQQRLGRNSAASGLTITNVASGSAAEEAGLRSGDVIVEVNRKPVSDPAEFTKMVRASANEPLLLWVESGSDRQGNNRATGRHYVTVQPR